MKREDFYFELPEELIAQDPLEDRSGSRLLVLDKETGKTEHHIFKEIVNYLEEGDCLVINDTKVLPARLIGSKVGTDAKIEVLLLKRRENDVWETLVKPGKKAKVGTKIRFGEGLLEGEVIDIVDEGTYDHDYKSDLQELVQKDGCSHVEYKVARSEGPDHDKTIWMDVYINGKCMGHGTGKNKKSATQKAAKEAMATLQHK